MSNLSIPFIPLIPLSRFWGRAPSSSSLSSFFVATLEWKKREEERREEWASSHSNNLPLLSSSSISPFMKRLLFSKRCERQWLLLSPSMGGRGGINDNSSSSEKINVYIGTYSSQMSSQVSLHHLCLQEVCRNNNINNNKKGRGFFPALLPVLFSPLALRVQPHSGRKREGRGEEVVASCGEGKEGAVSK